MRPSWRTRCGCCAAPVTRRSTVNRPSAANTAASALPTPTSPRRCGGWPTGTPPRCAWPCTPGQPCPTGRGTRLPELPKTMGAADRKASELAKACSGAVSVFVLHGREGEEFAATVLQIEPERNRAIVVLHEPPVRAHCAPGRPRRRLGDQGSAAVRRSGDPPVRGGAGRLTGCATAVQQVARCWHGRRDRPAHGLLLQHHHRAGGAGRARARPRTCSARSRTAEEAANALEIIRQREERKNAEDREWRDG